jgi:hypothetical protein
MIRRNRGAIKPDTPGIINPVRPGMQTFERTNVIGRVWTPSIDQRVNGLASLAGDNQKFKRIEIRTEGKASERVKDELSKRVIAYRYVSLVSGD